MNQEDEKLFAAIDFGTCNLKAAYNLRGKARSHKFGRSLGDDLFPNIITLRKDDMLIGRVQHYSGKGKMPTIIPHLKRHIEEKDWSVYVSCRDKEMTSTDILKEAFDWIRNNMEEKLHKPIEQAIITVPLCFSEVQKSRMRSCAEGAGLCVREIVNEPFAALFSYEELCEDDERNIIVFDFGGGTLDISLFNICEALDDYWEIETCAAVGLHLGGTDITELIYQKMIAQPHPEAIQKEVEREFRRYLEDPNILSENKNPSSTVYQKEYSRTRVFVENALRQQINMFKEEICCDWDLDETKEFITTDYEEIDALQIQLNYTGLVAMMQEAGFLEKIRCALEILLERSGKDGDEIQKVLLVGGTSQIQCFKELLAQQLENEDEDLFAESGIDAYAAVSIGAERYLLEKQTRFLIKDRLSYEIGVVENGTYQRCRSIATLVGEGSRRSVKAEQYPDGSLRVVMYQVFKDTASEAFDPAYDLIYMGYFLLPSEHYQAGISYLADFRFKSDGKLYADFHDKDGNTDALVIQTEEI